jgi:GNAT superfamily N-acetyltransferase
VTTTAQRATVGRARIVNADQGIDARRFETVPSHVYRRDANWTPPLPGEERETFDPRRNCALATIRSRRWILMEGDAAVGRIAGFTSTTRPSVGYFGFLECGDRPEQVQALLRTVEEWLFAQGCRECYGPIAVSPRDRIGLLMEGFDRPAMLFTPYNPPYYSALLEGAGYTPRIGLRGYGWSPEYSDPRDVVRLAERAAARSSIRIRSLRLGHLREETRLVARMINATLAEAWHFDPIGEVEADTMARLLRPILDPTIALVAEDETGPCGVALAVPDVNWLWRKAEARLWPLGWIRLLRWYRHIPQARLMALGLEPRVHGSGVAVRLIGQLHRAGLARGYLRGELSQVFDDNTSMRRILDRMGLPVVRRYAIFARDLR